MPPSHQSRRITLAIITTIVIAMAAGLVLIPAWQRARMGAEPVLVSSTLRAFAQALNAHQADDPSPHATVFILLHHRVLEPETLFMTRRTRIPAPPMPDIDAFNYQGITARDAYEQTVSREQIIAAAEAVLADDPWERIGSLWLIRHAPPWSAPDSGTVIVGFAFDELGSGRDAWIVRADASLFMYTQGDPPIAEELTTAIAAAESAGVAPPPQELIDFVHTTTPTR